MTPLPCPRCGYRLSDISDRTKPFVDCWCCDQCRSIYLVDHWIDSDGVGPERLVPVEVEA